MPFIRLTYIEGRIVTVNPDNITFMTEITRSGKPCTRIHLVSDPLGVLLVKETIEDIIELSTPYVHTRRFFP